LRSKNIRTEHTDEEATANSDAGQDLIGVHERQDRLTRLGQEDFRCHADVTRYHQVDSSDRWVQAEQPRGKGIATEKNSVQRNTVLLKITKKKHI
jgi:hypothetical protein